MAKLLLPLESPELLRDPISYPALLSGGSVGFGQGWIRHGGFDYDAIGRALCRKVSSAIGASEVDWSKIDVSTRPWDDQESLSPSPLGAFATIKMSFEDFFSDHKRELWFAFTADCRARTMLLGESTWPKAFDYGVVDVLSLWRHSSIMRDSSHQFIASIPPSPCQRNWLFQHVAQEDGAALGSGPAAVIKLPDSSSIKDEKSAWKEQVDAAHLVENTVMRLRCEDHVKLIPNKFPPGVVSLVRLLPGSAPVEVTLMNAHDGDVLAREISAEAESWTALPSAAFARVWSQVLKHEDEVLVIPNGYLVAMRSKSARTGFAVVRWAVPAVRGALDMIRFPWPGLDRAAVITKAAATIIDDVRTRGADPRLLSMMRPCLAFLTQVATKASSKAECRTLLKTIDEICADRS